MLPMFKDSNQNLMLMQSSWKTQLDPVIKNQLNEVSILKNIVLKVGVNVVNHLLGRMQQGWIITDVNGAATIYRSSAFNDRTLYLTSSAAVTINLGVF